MADKKIRENQLLAERGIALISEAVLGMGLIFRSTGVLDAGIDGEIELRELATGHVTNQIIKVQSKAVSKFQNETAEGFDFWPTQADMKYWLGGNVPVILVVSCPDTREAYWVAVKDYKQAHPTTKGIRFTKATTRLDNNAAPALSTLVKGSSYGQFTAPVQRTETLLSNLLPVTSLPERIYVAETEHRDRAKVFEALKAQTTHPVSGEWILKNERIFSLCDLHEFPYAKICEQGTVEDFPVAEWAQSSDYDKQREFVQLMNCALREKLYPLGIAFDGRHPHHCYYFRGQQGRNSRTFRYFASKKKAHREVFKVYRRNDGSTRYRRHSAFRGQFLTMDGAWYLEVTPTYYFTNDSGEVYPFYQEPLSGIKRIEVNYDVRGQLVMWIELLTRLPDMHTPEYPYLTLGRAETFTLPVGIDDADWLARENLDKALSDDVPQTSLLLV